MIIASAIKYRIEKTEQEVVLCGARHHHIIGLLPKLGFTPHEGYKEIAQGFITEDNTFLTRAEAFEHAKKCGQIKDDDMGVLMSEDLW